MKKTLVIGASDKPERYSNKAVKLLLENNYEVIAVGNKETEIYGIKIQKGYPKINDIDTITLYISESNQSQLFDYIKEVKPKRIIFNPGTENDELYDYAESLGIETIYACTLVMLNTNQY